MKILSGKTGVPHVTSQQFRQMLEGTIGQGSYILQSGENLEPELVSNNSLKIRSGIMCHHGNLSVVDLGTYDEVTIQNGTQGMKRIDLVVNRYTKNDETGLEANEWVVMQGTPDAESPVAPAHTEGNLQEGDLVDDCPVFRLHLDGINVTGVEKLLSVASDISTQQEQIAAHEEEISELNGNLSDLSSDINNMKSIQTISSGYSAAISLTYIYCVAYKIGRTVFLYGNIRNSNGITTNGEIKVVTLPASIKPLSSYVVLAVLNSTSTDIVTEGIIHKSDNAIYIKSHPDATSIGKSYIHFSGMYVTAS